MRIIKTLQIALVWTACVGICVPSITFAGATTSPTRLCDVALQDGGQLTGRFVDAAGKELVGETLAVYSNGREIARVATDENGQFRLRNLRGGMHQIVARSSTMVLRLWSEGTAPPAASGHLLLVSGSVVRGQFAAQSGCQGACGSGVDQGAVYYADGAGYGNGCESGCYGYGGQGAHAHGTGAGVGPWGRPLLIGGIIAAAVAIPVALADDDDARIE